MGTHERWSSWEIGRRILGSDSACRGSDMRWRARQLRDHGGQLWLGRRERHHQWAHEYAPGAYIGQNGHFVTKDPGVDHPDTSFTLAHLYMYAGSTDPSLAPNWIEVGWYKGLGASSGSYVTSPHYYYAYQDDGTYHEFDQPGTPDPGTTQGYQIAYWGYDFASGKYVWQVYWNDLSSPKRSIYLTNRPTQHALAGGEVRGTSTIHMNAAGVPGQRIQKDDGTYYTWNPSNFPLTDACESPDMNLDIVTDFNEFNGTGQT